MKKLLILLLLSVVCFLFAEELDRDIYMPEKLIHAELPEDISEDMEFLFRSNYEMCLEIHRRSQESEKKITTIQREIFEEMDIEKVRKLAYLSRLARYIMPEYSAEYALLNGRGIYSFLGQDKELDEKIHEKSYLVKTFGLTKHEVFNIFTASNISYGQRANEGQNESIILMHIWVRAKVLKSDTLRVRRFDRYQREGREKRLTSFVDIEIVEDISGLFPYDKLTIECNYTGPIVYTESQELLVENKEYLLPIRWLTSINAIPKNGDYYYPLVFPTVPLISCMLIEDEIVHTRDYFRKYSGFGKNQKPWTRDLFGEKISYDKAKEIIIPYLIQMKKIGGM
jgi:hypothetical protein